MTLEKNLIERLNLLSYSLIGFVFALSIDYLIIQDLEYIDQFWIREDGPVEQLTFMFLLACGVLHFLTIFPLEEKKELNRSGILMLSLFFIFGAMEEISWGQRIFDLETTDFFEKNNAQQETNIHNLFFSLDNTHSAGLRLDLGLLISYSLALFLALSHFLYNKVPYFRNTMNYFSFPIPKSHQTICFFIVFLIMIMGNILVPGLGWELLEFAESVILLSIIIDPIKCNYLLSPKKIL